MPSVACAGERRDVGERGDAARGDDRQPDLRARTPRSPLRRCRSARRRGRCRCRRSPRPRHRRSAAPSSTAPIIAGLGPALDRDPAVARVDADDDAAGKFARGAPHQFRIAQRGGAEHDPVDAETEPVIDRGAVADAAAELDAADRPRARIARTASPLTDLPANAPSRSTTCSQRKPGCGEAARLRRRIVVEHGRARHLAAHQAHAGAALQVDGGEQDHAAYSAFAAGSSRRL